jgi:membrane protease YdiL (CAAX protease family)
MSTTLALAVTLAVMVAWNVGARAGRESLLPIAGPLAAAFLLLVGRLAGLSWDDLGLGTGSMVRGLAWGGVAVAVIGVGYAVGLALPITRPLFLDQRHRALGGWSALYSAFLAVPLGTVVFEEVAFRGVLWGLVMDSSGAVSATVVSSLLFGAWHVWPALDMARANADPSAPPSRATVMRLVLGTVVFTGLSGVLFAVLRQQSGSLFAPALLHWATNGLGVLAAALAWRVARE